MKKQILMCITLSALVSCASTEQGATEASAVVESDGTDCISENSIRDYTVLDNSNLIATVGVRRKYHVELMRAAYGLQSSAGIGFKSISSRVCGRFSEIVVDNGFALEQVRIKAIWQLTPESEEELLIRFGKIEPKYEQPRQPEQVQGAEVEELD